MAERGRRLVPAHRGVRGGLDADPRGAPAGPGDGAAAQRRRDARAGRPDDRRRGRGGRPGRGGGRRVPAGFCSAGCCSTCWSTPARWRRRATTGSASSRIGVGFGVTLLGSVIAALGDRPADRRARRAQALVADEPRPGWAGSGPRSAGCWSPVGANCGVLTVTVIDGQGHRRDADRRPGGDLGVDRPGAAVAGTGPRRSTAVLAGPLRRLGGVERLAGRAERAPAAPARWPAR